MMKSSISKFAFLFKLAIQNILHNRLRSIIIFITFIIISILSLLTFVTKPLFNYYIYQVTYAKYADIDIILSVDDQSNTRFFSIKDL